MIVVSENKQGQKYQGLVFVEFLELLVRVSAQGFTVVEPVEYKVYWLL